MFSQSDSTRSHTASTAMSALTGRRVLTGGLAVIAGLIGSQLAAPVEALRRPGGDHRGRRELRSVRSSP